MIKENAYDVWKELRERFSQGDLFLIANLQDAISSLRQGDSSVTKFFTDLKILWDELEVFRPTPICKCSSMCACGAFSEIKRSKEVDHIIRFLKGLNDSFSIVRSQIMLMDPLPSINKVFSLVIQQECQLLVEGSINATALVNLSDLGQNSARKTPVVPLNPQGKASTKKACTYYGKSGHIVDTCYEKHGYPLLQIERCFKVCECCEH